MITETVPFEAPAAPVGHPLVRMLRALVVERRLPTALARGLDRLLIRLGLPTRVRRAGPFRFHTRRLTADEFYLRDVIERGEYRRPGYEIRPGDTVIDVGANIGSFAVPAARAAEHGTVIAVEPAPDNLALLRRNLNLNGARRVIVEPVALAGVAGSVPFERDLGNTGGHRIGTATFSPGPTGSSPRIMDPGSAPVRRAESPSFGPRTETVTAITLAELFARHHVERCQFLKLDCEGAEHGILATMEPVVAERIERLTMEYHADDEIGKPGVSAGLIQRLETLGFTVERHVDFAQTRLGLLFARRR